MVAQREVDGFSAVVVAAPEAEIEAAFVPEAGMVGCSLRHRGEELLGQRGGLASYVAERSTMGIPLLHPWANRLALRRFEVAGRAVDLDRAPRAVKTDPGGLPMHGLLAAARGWRVSAREETDDGGTVTARFDFAADTGLVRAFPFPHEVEMDVTLNGSTLTVATTVLASGDAAVPVAFGYHPYLRLPGVERADWRIEIPVRKRLALDDRMLPTGERQAVEVASGALGSRTFDDAYLAPGASHPFVVAGGGRRIAVEFESGYPYAQVYAPADDDVIALEPMTAPTNALVTGGPELPVVQPGERHRASFSITVTDTSG
jgi:galactose mutarotase-like enzyme